VNERTSRILFALEMVFFALPALFLLFGMMILSVVLFFITLGGLTAGSLSEFLRTEAIFLATGTGAVALWMFTKLSSNFLLYGKAGIARSRSELWRGLLLSIFPILVACWAAGQMQQELPVMIYMSGLPLLIPALHLWLAMPDHSNSISIDSTKGA